MTTALVVAPPTPRVCDLFGPYLGGADALRVNLGCGHNVEPGFLNLDRVHGHGADIVFDLEDCAHLTALPFSTGSVACVLASHVLEHITGLIPLLREIHRILQPGGSLIAVTPYASSDDAWEDPTHVRSFTERSWYYFNPRLYAQPNHAGSYPSPVDFCFAVAQVTLVPCPDYLAASPEMLEAAKRCYRNVIREMHAILRKDP